MAHFYDSVPEALKKAAHKEVVAQFLAGADVPMKAIAGLSREQLTAFPIPGTWSIQQIVIHLMDSDLVASYRMKRTIAEEEPKLDCYDESAFSKRLFYHDQDPRIAAELFERNRRATHAILSRLPDDAFNRAALHPETGRVTLGQLVRCYVHHLDHHMAFLNRKKEMMTR